MDTERPNFDNEVREIEAVKLVMTLNVLDFGTAPRARGLDLARSLSVARSRLSLCCRPVMLSLGRVFSFICRRLPTAVSKVVAVSGLGTGMLVGLILLEARGRRSCATGSSPFVVETVSDEVATVGRLERGPSVEKLAEIRRVDERWRPVGCERRGSGWPCQGSAILPGCRAGGLPAP